MTASLAPRRHTLVPETHTRCAFTIKAIYTFVVGTPQQFSIPTHRKSRLCGHVLPQPSCAAFEHYHRSDGHPFPRSHARFCRYRALSYPTCCIALSCWNHASLKSSPPFRVVAIIGNTLSSLTNQNPVPSTRACSQKGTVIAAIPMERSRNKSRSEGVLMLFTRDAVR